MSNFKCIKIILSISLSFILYMQLAYGAPQDIFLQFKSQYGKICQGTRIENKIITSALCVCDSDPTEELDLKEIVSGLFKKKKKIKTITLLNTSAGKELDVEVKIFLDAHACRFFEERRNQAPEAESSKMVYDRHFFDVAILEIQNYPSLLSTPNSFPQLTCVRQRSDDFASAGKLGIITRNLNDFLEVKTQRFSLHNKPNEWYEGLELFFTGYRIAPLKEHFSTNENQSGAPLISQTQTLLMKNSEGKNIYSVNEKAVIQIISDEEYDKLFIPGIVTHSEKVDESKGRAIYATPFFNVKKLLLKHIPAKNLSPDCLTGKDPEGFVEKIVIY